MSVSTKPAPTPARPRPPNLCRRFEGSQIRDRIATADESGMPIRCAAIPQVHGAVRDNAAHCRARVRNRANSAVDNPLVFVTTRKLPDGEG